MPRLAGCPSRSRSSADELSLAERRLRTLMRLYAALFALAGFAYLLLPNTVLGIANGFSALLTPSLPPIPGTAEHFWGVLGFAGMMTITFLAWQVQRDVRHRFYLVAPILLSKAVSTAVYAVLFFRDWHLAYLLGALTDLVLLLLAIPFWRQAAPSTDKGGAE